MFTIDCLISRLSPKCRVISWVSWFLLSGSWSTKKLFIPRALVPLTSEFPRFTKNVTFSWSYRLLSAMQLERSEKSSQDRSKAILPYGLLQSKRLPIRLPKSFVTTSILRQCLFKPCPFTVQFQSVFKVPHWWFRKHMHYFSILSFSLFHFLKIRYCDFIVSLPDFILQ